MDKITKMLFIEELNHHGSSVEQSETYFSTSQASPSDVTLGNILRSTTADQSTLDVTAASVNNVTSQTALVSRHSVDPDDVDRFLWIYSSPFILLAGLFGNLLILAVLRVFWKQKRLKTQHSNAPSNTRTVTVYLAVMAIADIVFISAGIVPEWLEAMELLDLGELHPVVCKTEKFVFYTSGDIAIWIITAFNIDRFIAVCFPLKSKLTGLRCCLKHPITLSIVITVTACAKNLHVFWTRGRVHDDDGDVLSNCGRPEPYAHFEEFVRPWLAFVLVSLIPTLILILCNISIIVTLKRAKRMRQKSVCAPHSTSGRKKNKSQSSLQQTIFMCMSASIAFIVCITPSMIIYIGRAYWTDPDDPDANPYAYDIAKALNNQLVYANHSINFILYCITGQKFREVTKIVLSCRTHEHPLTTRTVLTFGNTKTSRSSSVATVTGGTVRLNSISMLQDALALKSPSIRTYSL